MVNGLTFAETHRDLTEAEIADLPLEMRCCYFLYPWNMGMTGASVEEWADQIGFMRHDSVIDAISEAEDLILFVRAETDTLRKQRDELEQRLAECRYAKQKLQEIIVSEIMRNNEEKRKRMYEQHSHPLCARHRRRSE